MINSKTMDSEKTISSANDFSVNYDDYIQNCHWAGPDILFGLMFDYIKATQSILDIGIGTGLSSKLFRRFGLNVYGIERLALNEFEILKETEFLAYYNPDTNVKTYFNAIVARKQ